MSQSNSLVPIEQFPNIGKRVGAAFNILKGNRLADPIYSQLSDRQRELAMIFGSLQDILGKDNIKIKENEKFPVAILVRQLIASYKANLVQLEEQNTKIERVKNNLGAVLYDLDPHAFPEKTKPEENVIQDNTQ